MTQDRLVFFGTDAFSVPSLIRLLAEDWPIVAVVTKPDSQTGRGRVLTQPAVKRLAAAKGIPVLQPTAVAQIKGDLERLKPTVGIVVAYGKIIPISILELFPQGLINVHASLLPKYRGSSPIEAAIINGDDRTGVTLMQIDHGMDTGPTYASSTFQLAGNETKPDLYERLAEMGAELLATRLRSILDDALVPLPQDNSQAVKVAMIKKLDGAIDWSKPATTIEREIRAHLGWPGSFTSLLGCDMTITEAHVLPRSGKAGQPYKTSSAELAVYCGHDSLVLDRVKPAGKREMTGSEFLAGHPIKTS
jgi:methionyl-tRNA formyltransferase